MNWKEPKTIILGLILVSAMILHPLPVAAQTTTTVVSWVNGSGNTITIEQTFNTGTLVAKSEQWTDPTGNVVWRESLQYGPAGQVVVKETYDYHVVSAKGITTSQTFSLSGVIQTQTVEVTSSGKIVGQELITFDAAGNRQVVEVRTLVTDATGTQSWSVTVSNYSGGVLVSQQVSTYPFGHDFNAPPASTDPAPPTTTGSDGNMDDDDDEDRDDDKKDKNGKKDDKDDLKDKDDKEDKDDKDDGDDRDEDHDDQGDGDKDDDD